MLWNTIIHPLSISAYLFRENYQKTLTYRTPQKCRISSAAPHLKAFHQVQKFSLLLLSWEWTDKMKADQTELLRQKPEIVKLQCNTDVTQLRK